MFEIMTVAEANHAIEEAKRRSPISFSWKGQIPESVLDYIEAQGCRIHVSSVYMDGSAHYTIRYK